MTEERVQIGSSSKEPKQIKGIEQFVTTDQLAALEAKLEQWQAIVSKNADSLSSALSVIDRLEETVRDQRLRLEALETTSGQHEVRLGKLERGQNLVDR